MAEKRSSGKKMSAIGKTPEIKLVQPPSCFVNAKRRDSAPSNSTFFSTKILDTKLESSKQLKVFALDDPKESKKEFKDELTLDIFNKEYDGLSESRGVSEGIKFGNLVKSYSFNSYRGLFKETNEDKVCVAELIKKPEKSPIRNWPKISYFGVFDGHGGENCSIFLKENLLTYITEDKNFPLDIKAALIAGYEKAEEEFKKKYLTSMTECKEKSGSCALVTIIADTKIYIANLGDSRAIISMNKGVKFKAITMDHKPNNPAEFSRINKSGGKVYIDDDSPNVDITKMNVIKTEKDFDKYCSDKEVVYRTYPSNLAVTRTIGDIFSKVKELGGKPGIISNVPEVFILDNLSENDFIIMGCDGIFDELLNVDLIETCWYIFNKKAKDANYDINKITKYMCDMIIKTSLSKKSGDNLSCIIIGLEGLEKALANKKSESKRKVT